jgi:hypothetical protein
MKQYSHRNQESGQYAIFILYKIQDIYPSWGLNKERIFSEVIGKLCSHPSRTLFWTRKRVDPTEFSHITAFSFIHSVNLHRSASCVGIWITPTQSEISHTFRESTVRSLFILKNTKAMNSPAATKF